MAFLGWSDVWRPFREMERLSRTLDDLLARGRTALPSLAPFGEFPPLNVYATAGEVIVEAELPGVDPNDVDVSVTVDTLTLRGQRKPGSPEGASYHRREREMGEFVRSINLPDRIQTDKVEAKYANGVLSVAMPKSEEAKVQKVKITGGK